MAALFTDTFPWPDGTSLPTVSGGVYTKPTDFPNAPGISSHQATCFATGDHAVYLTSYGGSPTRQYAEITVATFDSYVGPTVFNSAAGDFYLLECVLDTLVRITRVRSNRTYTALSPDFTIPAIVSGTVMRIEGYVNLADTPILTIFRDGVAVGSYADASLLRITSGGAPGFRIWNAATRLSGFAAGDPAPDVVYVPVTRLTDTFASYSDGQLPTVSGGIYAKPSDVPAAPAIVGHLAWGPTVTTGEHVAYLTAFTGSTTRQWAEVTYQTPDNYTGPAVFNDAVGNFYMLNPVGDFFYFYRVDHTLVYSLINNFAQPPITAGETVGLSAEIQGGAVLLTAYRNGVAVGYHTDATLERHVSGVPGFRIWNPTVRLSQFKAGDYTEASSGVALTGTIPAATWTVPPALALLASPLALTAGTIPATTWTVPLRPLVATGAAALLGTRPLARWTVSPALALLGGTLVGGGALDGVTDLGGSAGLDTRLVSPILGGGFDT
jgi:hypothetical protein